MNLKRIDGSARQLRVRAVGYGRQCSPPGRRKYTPKHGRIRRRSEHFSEPVTICPSGRLLKDSEETLAYSEVKPDKERGPHRGGSIWSVGRRRTLHAIQQTSLYVGSDELVQPELAAEVVIERARRHFGR